MRNLTEHQVAVLSEEFNLADGHAYRKWDADEMTIIDETSAKFRYLDRRNHLKIESDYFESFYRLGQQTLHKGYFERFPCFTASSGIEIIANYLRINQLSVALIEPCFDNLADILKRHNIDLTAFPEEKLVGTPRELDEFLQSLNVDVLFLVTPNNPTGTTVSQAALQRILQFCRERQVKLILDTCFRFYLPREMVYDQYEMLIAEDVDCIFIEDTGKVWPTLEIKAPFISVSRRLVDEISRINSDFLLHVSPFAISLLTDFVRLAQKNELSHIHGVVAENRAALYRQLAGTFLRPVEAKFLSVSWLKIDADLTSHDMVELLRKEQVYVLAGNMFFWADERKGDSYLRIALSREAAAFSRGAVRLGEVCRRLAEEL